MQESVSHSNLLAREERNFNTPELCHNWDMDYGAGSLSIPFDTRCGSAPMESGYVPMQRGYAPMESGYAPVESGYAPMENGYAPVESGYASMESGYAPMESGYAINDEDSANRDAKSARTKEQSKISPKKHRDKRLREKEEATAKINSLLHIKDKIHMAKRRVEADNRKQSQVLENLRKDKFRKIQESKHIDKMTKEMTMQSNLFKEILKLTASTLDEENPAKQQITNTLEFLSSGNNDHYYY